ncbi:MAG: CapA family protein [Acidimicrobiia bacterium]
MSRRSAPSLITLACFAALAAACGVGEATTSDSGGPVISRPGTSAPSSTAAASATPAPTTTLAGTTTTATTAAPAPTTTAAPQPITIALAGDVHGEKQIAAVLAEGKNPLEFAAPVLTAADVAVVNLETVVGDAGKPQTKTFVFRAPPSLLTALRDAGVDVVSTANNHSFDFGRDGLLETLRQIAEAGLGQIGSGNNATEAYAPLIIDVRGTKVALLGIARVGPSDAGRATAQRAGTTNGKDIASVVAAIKAAKAQAPIVIAFMHWGIELDRCPQIADRDFAQSMLNAGASAVVGAHPHVLQGISTPSGKLVAYSLGNFVFYASRDAARDSGVLTLNFSPAGDLLDHQFTPMRIDTRGRPVPVEGDAAAAAVAEIESLAPDKGGC